jgi:hypothetical protein
MAFNLTTEDHALTVIISGRSVAEGLSMFPVLEQKFDGHKFIEDREVKTVVIGRLIMQSMEWHRQETETWPPRAVLTLPLPTPNPLEEGIIIMNIIIIGSTALGGPWPPPEVS